MHCRGPINTCTACAGRRPQADVVYFLEMYRREDQRRFSTREKTEFRGLLAHMALSLENRWQRHGAADLSQALMPHRRPSQRYLPGGAGRTHRLLQPQRPGAVRARQRAVPGRGPSRRRHAHRSPCLARDAWPGWRAVPATCAMPTRVMPRWCRPRCCRSARRDLRCPPRLTLQPGRRVPRVPAWGRSARWWWSARRQGTEHAHHDCLFARQFKLSEAQARVNALVFAGHSIASLAEVLHVSDNTVRSHLKQIFQKTNTHGQMELVRLHAQHCPPARAPDAAKRLRAGVRAGPVLARRNILSRREPTRVFRIPLAPLPHAPG
ncbi:helix-turn-helix transcriptional regulator [Cupriavidus basilensis]